MWHAAASNTTLTPGLLAHVQTAPGRRRLARALRPDGKRNWFVEHATGTVSIAPKNVLFIVGDSTLHLALEPDIAELEAACEARAAENLELLEVAWEVIHAGDGLYGGNSTNVEHFATVVFADNSPLSLYTAYLMLQQDAVYFKMRVYKGETLYDARSADHVKEAHHMVELLEVRARQEKIRKDTLLNSVEQRNLQLLDPVLEENDREYLIKCLRDMAVELDVTSLVHSRNVSTQYTAFTNLDDQGKLLVRQLLNAVKKPISPFSALDVLVAWRVFSLHENLTLHRLEYTERHIFAQHITEVADRLLLQSTPDLDHASRTDYRHLTAFAIDSADTTEVDDAISYDPETRTILVHIADVSRYFPDGPSNVVVQEALRRVATLYLPYDKLTMFPPQIANNLLSLGGHYADGSALTFRFQIAEDGSLVPDHNSIHASSISPPVRLTYDYVEKALSDEGAEHHQVLLTLYENATRRKLWREIEGGAILVNTPFAYVSVTDVNADEPQISLGIIKTDSKSWVMVSELMITGCTVAAMRAEKEGLIVPFRGQEPFDYPEDDVLEAVPDGPVRASLAFRNATPSETKTEPMEHASLGLDSYVQVTSPIRRSSDLVTHFQLKSHLRGDEGLFSEDDVNREIARSADVARGLRAIENRSKKYWQYEYLRRLGCDFVHKGTFVRLLKDETNRMGLVYLDEFGMQISVSVPSDLKPGASIGVQVLSVDPRIGLLRAEYVSQGNMKTHNEVTHLFQAALSDVSSDEDQDVAR